jgi:hypothetical protein
VVKFCLLLLCLCIPLLAVEEEQTTWDWLFPKNKEQEVSQDSKDGLDLFLKEHPKKQSNTIKDNKQYTFDPDVLQEFINNLDDKNKEKLIEKLMRDYSSDPDVRQKLLSDILEPTVTDVTFLKQLDKEGCIAAKAQAYPNYAAGLPLIGWLNLTNFPSLLQPYQKSVILNRGQFNAFNSLNKLELFLQPFGFLGSIDKKASSTKLDPKPEPFSFKPTSYSFKQKTLGTALGVTYSFAERYTASLGLGYSHSKIDWKKTADTASLNTLYFGPALSTHFSRGYLAATILGAVNWYHVTGETSFFSQRSNEKGKQKNEGKATTWDVLGRLEGALSLPIGSSLFLYPSTVLDYGIIFVEKSSKTLNTSTKKEEINAELTIDSFHKNALQWTLGLKLAYEHFEEGFGFISPYLSLDRKTYRSLNQDTVTYQFDGWEDPPNACKDPSKGTSSVGHWDYYAVGTGLELLHTRGILVSLDYTFSRGKGLSIHLGAIRIGLTW